MMHKFTEGQALLVFLLRISVAGLSFVAVHKKVQVKKESQHFNSDGR